MGGRAARHAQIPFRICGKWRRRPSLDSDGGHATRKRRVGGEGQCKLMQSILESEKEASEARSVGVAARAIPKRKLSWRKAAGNVFLVTSGAPSSPVGPQTKTINGREEDHKICGGRHSRPQITLQDSRFTRDLPRFMFKTSNFC
jgi:hypothetical protein